MTVGSHQTPIGKDDNRHTPPRIWRPVGPFATDAATSIVRPWNIGTVRNITIADDCLGMDWREFEETWLNPPFNRFGIAAFILKMCAHGRGIMLLHRRHDTQWWQPLWQAASGFLDIAGRVIFHKADGSLATIDDPQSKHFGKAANSGAPVTLVSFGFAAADRLAAVACRAEYDGRELVWPEGKIPGHFQPNMLHVSVLVRMIEAPPTWRALVASVLRKVDRPMRVAEVYEFVRSHDKARDRRHAREKVRQTLHRGAGLRVGPDQWVAAA